MKILLIGDIVGHRGRQCVARFLPELRAEYGLDLVVANAENAAGGLGATPTVIAELHRMGVHGITLGNHTWRKKELAGGLRNLDYVVRPANYPEGVPGQGSTILQLADGRLVGLVNLLGRVFMEPCVCPFETGLRTVQALRETASIVLVDFHAEATSEKVALGWHLDGLCTAVLGTHTHVQTADERVLPKGTAYMTDVGMTGPIDSVIGVERERAIRKFLTGMPSEFKVAKGRASLCGALLEVDDTTGLAISIQRISRIDNDSDADFDD